MKKRILIAFILSFGIFVLLCASENSTATILEGDKKIVSASNKVEVETPEITATPSSKLEIPSPTLSAENIVEQSQYPAASQGIQEVRISRPKRVLLKPGESTNFRIFLMPTDITDAKVVFEIEDKTIAELSYYGIPEELKETAACCTITGLQPGRTVINITVTSEKGSCTDSCIIVVGDDFM